MVLSLLSKEKQEKSKHILVGDLNCVPFGRVTAILKSSNMKKFESQ